jgi:hypothetical protein
MAPISADAGRLQGFEQVAGKASLLHLLEAQSEGDTMTEPTDKEQYLNIADQCAATATSDLAASILVDGGSGTLRQLLNDAADAIRAGWRAQPTAEGGIKWQCGPLASGFTAPHPAAMTLADRQRARRNHQHGTGAGTARN